MKTRNSAYRREQITCYNWLKVRIDELWHEYSACKTPSQRQKVSKKIDRYNAERKKLQSQLWPKTKFRDVIVSLAFSVFLLLITLWFLGTV